MLILLTICSIVSGDCRTETVNLDAHEMTPNACIAQAQPAIASYMAAYPNYDVKRFRCVPANRREHAI